jgi:hypothetical protein
MFVIWIFLNGRGSKVVEIREHEVFEVFELWGAVR